jgi:glycosyltransferase involved in cell wall biosynthesis
MDSPLILQAMWTLGRAGAERIVFELAKRLPEAGFRVQVVAAGGGGEMEEDFREAGIPLALGPTVPLLGRAKTISFLKQQIKQTRPAIIHSHLLDGWMSFARPKAIPWAITAHNDDRDDSFMRHALRGRAFRQADRVVCVSEAVRRYVKKEFSVSADRLLVIPNGIDLQDIPLRGTRPFHDVPTLLVVGRLVEQKNHALLLHGLSQVRGPWTLDIVGDGPLRHPLERLAHELRIRQKIRFLGTVDPKQVQRLLQEADLFCFPSSWEGQGLALLEAAAVGVPIVASDLPVFHETFGLSSLFYAAPHSASQWTRMIERALLHPRESLGKAKEAQQRVWHRHAIEPMVRAYAEVYREILKKKG